MKPWEQYADAAPEAGPWSQYASDEQPKQKVAALADLPKKGAPITRTEKLIKGARDPLDGGAQLLTNLLPAGVVKAGNAVNNWLADKTGLVGRLPEGGVDQQVQAGEAEYQARREQAGESGFDGWRMAGNVLSPVNVAAAAKLPQAASLAGRIGIGAGYGGGSAALAPVAGDDYWSEKGKQVMAGAAGGGVTPLATGAITRIISPRASVNPQLQLLRKEGVRPTIGQSLGGWWNAAEEKLTSVPILGDAISSARTRSLNQFNEAALNRATSPIGRRVTGVGRDGVSQAKGALSKAYEDLLPTMRFDADTQFSADLSRVQSMVDSSLARARGHMAPPGEADIFDNIIRKQIVGKMTPAGTMSGETFKQVEGEISRLAKGYKGDASFDKRQIGSALDEVLTAMRGSLQRANPDKAASLNQINKGFANYARVRDAAGRVGADEGLFTPNQLQSAVRTADKSVGKGNFATGKALMQDLSEAGKAVIGNKVPNSFTTDRALIAGGTLGSYLVNPAIPAGLLGGAALYSKPVQALLTGAATLRPQSAKAIAEALKKRATSAIPFGAQVGLGLLNQ